MDVTLAVLFWVLFPVATVLFVLRLVRWVHEARVAKLELDGLVRKSGRVRMTIRLRGYRGHGMLSSRYSVRYAELVLTQKGLWLVAPFMVPLGAAPWAGLTVEVRDGRLHLHTETPPGATGSVDVLASVAHPSEWAAALGVRTG